jgi:hypothetical protein
MFAWEAIPPNGWLLVQRRTISVKDLHLHWIPLKRSKLGPQSHHGWSNGVSPSKVNLSFHDFGKKSDGRIGVIIPFGSKPGILMREKRVTKFQM